MRDLTRRAVLLCIATTALVATVEITIGTVFGLLSVFAEGLHTGADLLDSLAALALVSIALRPPDSSHPYGHGKFDTFAGVLEGFCVAGSGVWAAIAAGRVLLGWDTADAHVGPAALGVMLAASVLYLFVSRYVLRLAARTGSAAVYAEGMHLMTHIYVTGGLALGLAFSWFAERQGWAIAPWVDPIMALGLGIFLVGVGVRIVAYAGVQLSDAALPAADRERIVARISEFATEYIEVHALRSRQAGSERHVDIHLIVRGDMTVEASHALAHRIERAVRQDAHNLRLLVHVEPATPEMMVAYERRGRRGSVVTDDFHHTAFEASHHPS